MRIRTRIFLGISIGVLVFVGTATVAVQSLLTEISEEQILSDLAQSAAALQRYERQREELVLTQTRAMAQAAHLKATMTIPDVDAQTISVAAMLLKQIDDPPLLLIVDAYGDVLFDAGDAVGVGGSLAVWPYVNDALDGVQRYGVWEYGGIHYQIGIAPIVSGGQVLGLVATGHPLADAEAYAVAAAVSGAHVVISMAGEVLGTPTAMAAPLDFAELRRTPRQLLARTDGISLYEAVLDGESFVLASNALAGGAGELVLFRSHAAVAARTDVVKKVLLALSAFFLAIGVFFSFRLSNRVSKPIVALTQAAESFSQGDFDSRVTPQGGDELAELGRAFNAMGDDIVTQRKEILDARDAAEAASRAKSDFLATMSHEIRTPMNGVLGMTELLLAGDLGGRQRHLAQTAHASAQSLLDVINDILDFSKIEAGKLDLHEEPFELQQFLEDVVALMAEPAHRKFLELLTVLAPMETVFVQGDASRLRQILVNLLGNAIKFTSDGEISLRQTIEFDDDSDRCMVRLDVVDTGVGIPADKLERIFEAFSQSDSSTSRTYGGSGLGLAISRQLVALMDGTLSVESEVDVGSCFTLRLPMTVCESDSAGVADVADVAALQDVRVICVDDHAVNLDILQNYAHSWGMQASTATSAESALEQLRAAARVGTPYRIALLDWKMPKMNGGELARAILADPLIPDLTMIVLSSAHISSHTLANVGVTHHLTKPLRRAELLARLRVALGEPEPAPSTDSVATALQHVSTRSSAARILIAEDNPVNQEVIVGILELFGCSTTVVGNGEEAVAAVLAQPFDLVLMDCHMPGMDGFAATRDIRASELSSGRTRVPVIALTADVRKGIVDQCTDAGMDGYLSKPFDQTQIAAVLEQWIAADASATPPATERAATAVVPACLDAAVLDQFRSLGAATGKNLLATLITKYSDHAPDLARTMRSAFEGRDWQQLADAAHSLKSSSSNVGATRLAQVADALELAARAPDPDIQALAIAELEKEFVDVMNALASVDTALVEPVEQTSPAVTEFTDGAKILLIDDDPTVRLATGAALRAAGFEVMESDGGARGLQQAELMRPNLVLVDAIMPDLDGFAVCERMKETPTLAHVPIVMATGLHDVQSVQRAFSVGASGFTLKPINHALLLEQVRFILRASDTEERLRAQEGRLSSAQRMARLGYWRWDAATEHFEPSEHLSDLCGVEAGTLDTDLTSYLALIHPDDRERVRQSIELTPLTQETVSIEYRVIKGDGQEVTVRQDAEVKSGRDGAVSIFGTIQDITHLRAAEERVWKLAYYDPLTALASRSYLMQRTEETIKAARRRGESFALMFMDLDGFKDINDTLGHDVGDQLLVAIAGRLRETLRDCDFVARLGGDEFCVLLDEVDSSRDIVMAADRCLRAVRAQVDLGSRQVRPQMSIGIAQFPEDGDSTQTLLKAADSAMYAAKQRGKNRFEFYSPDMTVRAEERLTLAGELREAFSREEFELHYQPQIDLKTGTITAVEGLVRWHHPERGLLFPIDFVPELERIGLVEELGEYVLNRACDQWVHWTEAGLPPVRMSVNISPDHFLSPSLQPTIETVLARTGVDPHWLEVEITESAAQDHDEAVATLERLKAIGITIAIDDFGTGYSSLGSLKHLPIDCLKVDRVFIRDLLTNPKDAVLLATIFNMAHALNVQVVAEGVEEYGQIATLVEHGCDLVQGYYFCRPGPASKIGPLLSKTFDLGGEEDISALTQTAVVAANAKAVAGLRHGLPH